MSNRSRTSGFGVVMAGALAVVLVACSVASSPTPAPSLTDAEVACQMDDTGGPVTVPILRAVVEIDRGTETAMLVAGPSPVSGIYMSTCHLIRNSERIDVARGGVT